MAATGWLLSAASELPPGREWLSRREREALSGLRYEKRRRDWLLGRWTAKRALAAWLDAPLGELEVIAADDGVPEPFRRGEPAPAALSISHRGGRALAAVAQPEAAVGCDLELVERRSPAFLREWLAPAERELVGRAAPGDDVLLANLVWCAKEAAAKARRGGLRLNVRRAIVSLAEGGGEDGWRALDVRWQENGDETSGWWREDPGWVMSVVSEPASGPPALL